MPSSSYASVKSSPSALSVSSAVMQSVSSAYMPSASSAKIISASSAQTSAPNAYLVSALSAPNAYISSALSAPIISSAVNRSISSSPTIGSSLPATKVSTPVNIKSEPGLSSSTPKCLFARPFEDSYSPIARPNSRASLSTPSPGLTSVSSASVLTPSNNSSVSQSFLGLVTQPCVSSTFQPILPSDNSAASETSSISDKSGPSDDNKIVKSSDVAARPLSADAIKSSLGDDSSESSDNTKRSLSADMFTSASLVDPKMSSSSDVSKSVPANVKRSPSNDGIRSCSSIDSLRPLTSPVNSSDLIGVGNGRRASNFVPISTSSLSPGSGSSQQEFQPTKLEIPETKAEDQDSDYESMSSDHSTSLSVVTTAANGGLTAIKRENVSDIVTIGEKSESMDTSEEHVTCAAGVTIPPESSDFTDSGIAGDESESEVFMDGLTLCPTSGKFF